jgi:hypothetical protein
LISTGATPPAAGTSINLAMEATMKIGRNAGTGRFTSVSKARADKKGSVVETIKRSAPPKPKKK